MFGYQWMQLHGPLTHFYTLILQHQIDGIKFMWANSCCDLPNDPADTQLDTKGAKDEEVGGCILAHNMGLGKSVQAIALLHTLLHHPSLSLSSNESGAGIISSVLLVAPKNTVGTGLKQMNFSQGRNLTDVLHSAYSFFHISWQIGRMSSINGLDICSQLPTSST